MVPNFDPFAGLLVSVLSGPDDSDAPALSRSLDARGGKEVDVFD